MMLPPWHRSAAAAAARAPDTAQGEAAKREAERWERMRDYQGRVLGSLAGASVLEWGHRLDDNGEHDRTPTGLALVSAQLVQLGDGQTVSIPDARLLREDWAADPVRTAERMQACGACWPVAPTPQGWRAHPMTCGSSLCPLCVSMGAGERRELWTETLTRLAAQGYHVVLMTRTRRARDGEGNPVVWTQNDGARWPRPSAVLATEVPAHPTMGPVGAACPGESLGQAWDALTGAWRDVIDSRAAVRWKNNTMPRREWWTSTVVCQLDAVEGTQLRVEGEGDAARTYLRWHIHGHTILVLAPDAIDVQRDTVEVRHGDVRRRELAPSCAWWRTWLDAWTGAVDDAEERPQHAVLVGADVDGSGGIAAALREVVKYPGKLSEMTDAGVIEWLATVKGRRPLREGGTLHGATLRGRVAHAVDVLERMQLDVGAADALADELRQTVIGGRWPQSIVAQMPPDDACAARIRLELRTLKAAGTEGDRREAREGVAAACALAPVEVGGGDYADAGVRFLRSRLDSRQEGQADDVGRAMAAAAAAVERRREGRRPEGLVYTPPIGAVGDTGTEWHLLDWRRLLTLARCGVRVGAGWRLHGPEGPPIPAVRVRDVIRAVETFESVSDGEAPST